MSDPLTVHLNTVTKEAREPAWLEVEPDYVHPGSAVYVRIPAGFGSHHYFGLSPAEAVKLRDALGVLIENHAEQERRKSVAPKPLGAHGLSPSGCGGPRAVPGPNVASTGYVLKPGDVRLTFASIAERNAFLEDPWAAGQRHHPTEIVLVSGLAGNTLKDTQAAIVKGA